LVEQHALNLGHTFQTTASNANVGFGDVVLLKHAHDVVEFKHHLFEPQFIGLMDRDEQMFVVGSFSFRPKSFGFDLARRGVGPAGRHEGVGI
jgi:hypothetical protein